MRTVSLSGSLRENVGKKDAKALRRAELVPCVLYGGEDQVHFSMAAKDFKTILFTKECFIINLNINGKSYNSILQDAQYHPITDEVLHADFLLVKDDKAITVNIPVITEGTPVGVMRGGKMKQKIQKVKVSGLAKFIPESIILNVTNMNIGDSIKIRDLKQENVRFLNIGASVVVDVMTARGVAEDEAEAK